MIIEIRHDIMGAFGKTYIEERTTCTDDETVKIALATFRKDKWCVLWIEEIGDVADYGSVTGICVSWDTIMEYNSKVCKITRYYGFGNISDEERVEWSKARAYLKKVIKTY